MNRQQLIRNLAEVSNGEDDQPVTVIVVDENGDRVKGFPMLEVHVVKVNDYDTIVVEVRPLGINGK
jgi:hypothetical protein